MCYHVSRGGGPCVHYSRGGQKVAFAFNTADVPDARARRFLQHSREAIKRFPEGVFGCVRSYRDGNGDIREGVFAAPLTDRGTPRFLLRERSDAEPNDVRLFEMVPQICRNPVYHFIKNPDVPERIKAWDLVTG